MATVVRKTVSSRSPSLRDALARLTFPEACKLLGPEGKRLIQLGASQWEIDSDRQARLKDDRFVLRLDGDDDDGLPPIVTLAMQGQPGSKLTWDCSDCGADPCEHVGAAFSLILEDKIALGLAAAPRERQPIESLDEQSLVEQALAERADRAASEKMTVQPFDRETPWTDYTVTSRTSGKTYRVALRGLEAGQSYCSCPDFRTNTLGTCKHVLHVAAKVRRRFNARQLKRPFQQKQLALHLNYVGEVTLRLLAPNKVDPAIERIIKPLRGQPITDLHDLMNRLTRLQKAGRDVLVYPDAEEWIQQRPMQDRLTQRMVEIRRDPVEHPLRCCATWSISNASNGI